MATPNFLKIITDYISSLPDNDFLLFCDRLLAKIFPDDYSDSLAFIQNGYASINNDIYSFFPSTTPVNTALKNISPVISKSKSKLVILANVTLKDSQKLHQNIKRKFKNRSTEIWEHDTIRKKIKDFPNDELTRLIGTDSTFSSYFRISVDQKVAFSYYQDIFTHIFKSFDGPLKPCKIDPSKSEFAKILKKIPLNFSKAQNIVWEIYSNSYQFKNLAEKFLQEQYKIDDDFKKGIISSIHYNFCTTSNAPRTNYPVNDFRFIEQMASRCLKSDYKEDEKLLNLARGIIMYFFELCEFGARNEQDQLSYFNPSLFDNQKGENCADTD